MTNKLKQLVLLLSILILMGGCLYKNDATVIINANTEALALTYNRLAIQILSSDKFTSEELKKLQLIDRKAKFIITEFRLLKIKSDITGAEMYNLYKRVKVLYIEGSDLIKARYSVLPENIQLLLYEFDYASADLDRKVEAAAADSEKRKQALQDIQKFTFSIFKLLIPLLLV